MQNLDEKYLKSVDELKKKHNKEMQHLTHGYETKLFEEKEATKCGKIRIFKVIFRNIFGNFAALDALQKAHEHEMDSQNEKWRQIIDSRLTKSEESDADLKIVATWLSFWVYL